MRWRCSRCHGKGWYMVPNGPDDCEKEPCEYCNAFEMNFTSLGTKPTLEQLIRECIRQLRRNT